MVKRHHKLMLGLLRASDLAVVVAAWMLAYGMHLAGARVGWLQSPTHSFSGLLSPMAMAMVLAMLIFSRMGLYEPKRTKSLIFEAAGIAQAVLLVWMITYAVASFASSAKLSRATMGLVLVDWLVLAMADRVAARIVLRRLRLKGINLRHAAIVGTGRLAQRLYHVLAKNKWTGIEVRYFIDDVSREKLLGLKILGSMKQIDEIVNEEPVDIVFVALPGRQREQIELVLSRLAMSSVDVRLVPDLLSFHFLKHDITQLDELPIVTLTHSPQHGWNSVIKRVFDIVGAIAAMVVFAIPMIILAAMIKLTSRGPVFYCQARASLGDRVFTIVKFRTMIENAEADSGAIWASSNDARVTRIGRFLRRTSLDELPQLFNVLLGQMSLVGPRPERPELIRRFREKIPRYMLRNQVKAGMTGWAQVNGLRGKTSLRKRVQYDLYYISNWSLGLDLWILFVSLFRGFINPHAY